MGIENPEKKIYGFQYHPEVTHSEKGLETLKHFLLEVCGLEANWSMADVLEDQLAKIKAQVRLFYTRTVCKTYLNCYSQRDCDVVVGTNRW